MFKFFLNFIDLPQIGLVEIQEPFGFDGATHEIKQEPNKHSRNVIIANADIKLEFTRHNFKQYDYLDAELERKGWEMNVELILQKDNLTFTTGIIDGLTAQRFRDSIEFNIIQNTVFEFIKKNESIEINAFSDKSLKGDAITPCQTSDIFLKAKPIFQTSEWDSKNIDFVGTPDFGALDLMPVVNNLVDFLSGYFYHFWPHLALVFFLCCHLLKVICTARAPIRRKNLQHLSSGRCGGN